MSNKNSKILINTLLIRKNIKLSNINDLINLKDKNVCIVSYALYMKDKKLGNYIDTFDDIVRINIGIKSVNIEDFGTKTTIGSFSVSKSKIHSIEKTFNKNTNILDILDNLNIKYFVGLSIKVHEINYFQNYFFKIKNSVKQILISDYNKYVFGITSGLKTIIYILQCKPKKLYICGFDFSINIYEDYKKIHVNQSTQPDIIINNVIQKKRYEDVRENWHSSDFELYIFKKLYMKYNFEVDDCLKKIINDLDITQSDNNIFKATFENINVNYIYIDKFNYICNLIDNNI